MKVKVDSSTGLLLKEAARRNITAVGFPKISPNVFILELGDHREPMYYTSTDKLGHVTFKIFLNKALTDAILLRAVFPAPASLSTDKTADIEAFLAQHQRIVIKPKNSVWGQGVTPGLTAAADIPAALDLAQSFNGHGAKKVICQEHIDGDEYRLLVVGMEQVLVVHRIPAHVLGDGVSTTHELIDHWNETVQDDRKIVITKQVEALLKSQQQSVDSVPKKDERILLKLVANAHAGGIVEDATDVASEEAKETAREIARYFNVAVVGVDCISPDITQGIGRVIELNSTPDITLHHNPTSGEPRDAAGAIMDVLFPETKA